MADSDLSVLFKLRGDSRGAVKATAETRAAVNQLRQSFGPQLAQSITVANKSFGSLNSSLLAFGSQVPVVGPLVTGLTKSVDTLGRTGTTSAGGIQGLTRSLGGLAAIGSVAAVGGLVALGKSMSVVLERSSQLGGEIFDLTQKTGLSAERITALKFAADQSGGSIEKFSNGIKNFSLEIANANKGSEEATEKLKRLGIDPRQAIFDLDAALSKALQTIAKAPPGIAQMTLAADAFGRKVGPELIPTIVSFDGNLDALTERAKKLGVTLTDLEAQELDEFGDALDTLKTQGTLLAARFSAQVAPEIVDALRRISEGAGKNRSAVEEWGQGFAEVIRGVRVITQSELGRVVGDLTNMVIQIQPLFLLLKGIRGLGAEARTTDPAEDFFGPGGAARGGRKTLPGTPEFKRDQTRASRQEDLEKFLESLANTDNTDSALNKAKAALANQLEALQDSIGDRESAFQAETENLRRELAKREIDFKKYIETSTGKNKERLDETLADLQKERDAVSRALAQKTIDEDDAAKKTRQIDNRERDARRAATREQQRLDDEAEANKRKQLEATTEILRATIDAQLRIAAIGDQQREASIRALAAMRVKTEEQAEREILQIRLAAIDRERERLETEVKATESITDPEEQLKERARLNLELRVLVAERVTIEQDGERDIEASRQRDLGNERDYADELEEIRERVRDIERDTAEEAIRLMSIHFARRKDIIRARLQADIADENSRHEQALETIANLEQENRESNRTEQEKLKAEEEINRLHEAEAERHRLAMQGIKDQGKKDEAEADPLGRLELDVNNLKEFARVLEESIVPLGEILTRTFSQVADAIGQTVANWVLLGETGPAVMRKILAQALASIAAEAAVNAIKELALGFATLFFNPAESAAHFTAAGLWASIGVGSALAGRAVAGDLFKQKSGTSGSGGTSSQGPRDLNPITLGRNQPQIIEHRHTLDIRVNDSEFGRAVTATISKDWRNGGKIRELVLNDSDI